jgi:hypothetical protein
MNTSPTLITPNLGTPTALVGTNITGTAPGLTAGNVSGVVALNNGGTGQTTQQTAINALAGGVISGRFLRGDGTNITLSTIQSGDVPILNQNTTGTATNVTGVVAIVNGGTGSSTQNFVDLTTNQTVGGAKTWSALGTFNLGLSSSGAPVNINAGSNFATNINTGGSTGALTLGNASNSIAVAGIISGGNPLVFEGASPNAFETTFAITDPTADRTITFPNASGTVALENAGANWVVSGNAGTNPSTNFLGTTDNNDLVFKANNLEVARLETTGYLKMGDANSGTIRASRELVFREDGDVYGTSLLRLRNRNGENGAIFETIPLLGANLVDFIFKTSDGGSGTVQRNLRFETRSGDISRTGSPSFHLAGENPDLPTLSLGDNYSAFSKPLYIGLMTLGSHPIGDPYPSPTALLQLAPGTAAAGTAPLKFTSGTLLSTTEAGAIEFNNNSYYATITTGEGTSTARGTLEVFMPTNNLANADQTITPNGSQIFTMSPTANRTITFSGAGANVGSRVYIYIIQTTTTSRTITFAGICLKAGTLATGTTSGTTFVVSFVFNGTSWTEVSRTAALQ